MMMMMAKKAGGSSSLALRSICFFLFCVSLTNALNLRPIVGVLTQPLDSDFDPSLGTQYLPASYVKFLESGGARVVPVFYNATYDELQATFDSINGILFPGGDSDLDRTQFFRAGQFFYNASLEAAKNGDYFPIFGHCQGFEMLTYITSNNMTILTGVDAENLSLALNFTSAMPTSRWLMNASAEIIEILATENVTLNNHVFAITPEDFYNNDNLVNFYTPLSTNRDRNGKEFISTMEGINNPVYGIQWHAEKPLFEWNPDEAINHSPDAVRAMQYFADFIADEARKSYHQYPSAEDEQAALIYNYNPVYTAPFEPDFEQCYFW